jgi:hypothetical protein
VTVMRQKKHQHEIGWVCPACKQKRGKDYDDPCIAGLPGVEFACCGHGRKGEAYIYFKNGVRIGMEIRSITYDPLYKLRQAKR